MAPATPASLPVSGVRPSGMRYVPGDLVVSRAGYPVLYEVVCVYTDGLLRLRGVDWAAGYTALIAATGVRPASAILHAD